MAIPQSVRVTAAIAQQQAYRGELPVGSLPRLRAELAGEALLQVDLQAVRQARRDRLTGSLSGGLPLHCQRCERDFVWPLDVAVDIQLVYSDEEEQSVLHDADPYRVEDDTLPLRELIEDEVLLALPMLPRCESCENDVMQSAAPVKPEQGQETQSGATVQPFAALRDQLKSKR